MPALLTDSVAYAQQVLRNQKVETLSSRRANPAGRPVEDQVALARQKAVENQVASDPTRYQSQKDLLRQPGVENVIPNETTANQLGDESVMILSARGTFYLVKLATSYGPGIYAIDELTRDVVAPDFTGPVQNDSRQYRPGAVNSPILLTSIEFNQTDITSQVPCLNNIKVFYSFGQNFGQVVISGEVLLGPLGNISYEGVNRLVDFFWKYRVSVYERPIAISVANNAYFMYLTGLRIGQVNADFHILPFVMFGTLLDIKREQANAVTTTGVVITGGNVSEPSLFEALTAELPDAARDTKVNKVGEDLTPLSQDYNPWANQDNPSAELTEPVTNKGGSAGNSTAAKIQQDLTSDKLTNLDKDAAALRKLAGDQSLSEAERKQVNLARRGAHVMRSQERNLLAGKPVQVPQGPDKEAVTAYQEAIRNNQIPAHFSPPSYVLDKDGKETKELKQVGVMDTFTTGLVGDYWLKGE